MYFSLFLTGYKTKQTTCLLSSWKKNSITTYKVLLCQIGQQNINAVEYILNILTALLLPTIATIMHRHGVINQYLNINSFYKLL
jgi:hypothetical protein